MHINLNSKKCQLNGSGWQLDVNRNARQVSNQNASILFETKTQFGLDLIEIENKQLLNK